MQEKDDLDYIISSIPSSPTLDNCEIKAAGWLFVVVASPSLTLGIVLAKKIWQHLNATLDRQVNQPPEGPD